MAKIAKSFVAHERMPKKTSQGTSKRVKKSVNEQIYVKDRSKFTTHKENNASMC